MTKHKVVYVPISVKEKLPKETNRFYVFTRNIFGTSSSKRAVFDLKTNKWIKDDSFDLTDKVTHWLEPLQDQFVLSRCDLADLFARFAVDFNIEECTYEDCLRFIDKLTQPSNNTGI